MPVAVTADEVMVDYRTTYLEAVARYENDFYWSITGEVDETGEMNTGDRLYVTFASDYGDPWLQVFYPTRSLDVLRGLRPGDEFTTECIFSGRGWTSEERDYWRVECWSRAWIAATTVDHTPEEPEE